MLYLCAGRNTTMTWALTNTGNVRLVNATFSAPGIQGVSCGSSTTAASTTFSLEVDASITCRCVSGMYQILHLS